MENDVAVVILCEVLITLFCVWGLLHEDVMIRWERKRWKTIKMFIRRLKETSR